jgi:hypothetical protein
MVANNDQIKGMPGAVENFDRVWETCESRSQEPKGEPAYSQAIQEIHDLYRRMKKTEE